MKVIAWAISLLVCLMMFSITGCPTCVGRMERGSPPFFSDEFYTGITLPHTPQPLHEDTNDANAAEAEDVEDNGDDDEDGVSL